jgi:hypothetical protein
MPTMQELVRSMSDTAVVEVVKELFEIVYSEVSYDDVKDTSASVPKLKPLASLDEDALQSDLTAAESAKLSRALLEQFAADPNLSPLIEQAWNRVLRSDNMIVEVIVAVGLIANLTLFVATTGMVQKGADGKITWSFGKKEAGPELVQKVIDPLVKLVRP